MVEREPEHLQTAPNHAQGAVLDPCYGLAVAAADQVGDLLKHDRPAIRDVQRAGLSAASA